MVKKNVKQLEKIVSASWTYIGWLIFIAGTGIGEPVILKLILLSVARVLPKTLLN